MTVHKEWHVETLGKKVVEALQRNGFTAEYAPTNEDARQKIMSLIPAGASIGLGGSMTIKELELSQEIEKGDYKVLDHSVAKSPEERLSIRRQQLTADRFIASANAVTLDGKLVNMDGTGNRVAASIYGPSKIIIVAGINKIARDLDSAVERIEMYASPLNNKRLKTPNPCTKSGVCSDCQGDTRLCNVMTIMHRRPKESDITVIIVGSELGY